MIASTDGPTPRCEVVLARRRAPSPDAGAHDRAERSSRLVAFAGLVAIVGALAACGPKAPAVPPLPPPVALHLEPACDLASSAGLAWIVEAKPRALAEVADLIPAIALVLPEERLRGFTKLHAVDLRQVTDLCVARYKDALLTVARVPLDAQKVAATFEERSTKPAVRTLLAPNPPILRVTAAIDRETWKLVLFGREALTLEQRSADAPRDDSGPDSGPGRVATAFALGKLKRSAPALRGVALRRASEVLGEASIRVLAPGPFEGEMAKGLGGLLRAATAVGGSVRWAGVGSNLLIRVVLTGAWAEDAAAASERFGAAAHVLSESAMGRLFGLHRPVRAPVVHIETDALVLDATIDGDALARGLHDAVDAEVADIMRR